MVNRRVGKSRPLTFAEMDENLQILQRHGREWSSGYTYSSGETVYYNGSIYIANTTTTSGSFESAEWTEFITAGTTTYISDLYDNSTTPTAPQPSGSFTISFTGDTQYLEWDLTSYAVGGDYDVTLSYSGRTFETRQVGYLVLDIIKASGDTLNITLSAASGDTVCFIPSSYASYTSSTKTISINGLLSRYVLNSRMIYRSNGTYFYEYSVTELQT